MLCCDDHPSEQTSTRLYDDTSSSCTRCNYWLWLDFRTSASLILAMEQTGRFHLISVSSPHNWRKQHGPSSLQWVGHMLGCRLFSLALSPPLIWKDLPSCQLCAWLFAHCFHHSHAWRTSVFVMLTGIYLQVCIILALSWAVMIHRGMAPRFFGWGWYQQYRPLSSSNYSSFAQLSDPQELERMHSWRYDGLQTIRPQIKHCSRVWDDCIISHM